MAEAIERVQEGTELAVADMEALLMQGDLGRLSPAGRLAYYKRRCEDVGLDPLARPFDYLNLNGKLVLYANKGCFEQLRSNRKIAIEITKREKFDDLFVVTAKAILPDGRSDEDTGAVDIGGLKGEKAANAIMKAVTKAKRRVTLSLCGLGLLDETEVDSIPRAARVRIDAATGEVLEETKNIGGKEYSSLGPKLPGPCSMCDDPATVADGFALYCDKHKVSSSSAPVGTEAGSRSSSPQTPPVAPTHAQPGDTAHAVSDAYRDGYHASKGDDLHLAASDVPQDAPEWLGVPPETPKAPQAKKRGRPPGPATDIGPFMEHMERAKIPWPDGLGEAKYREILISFGFKNKADASNAGKAARSKVLRKMIETFQTIKEQAATPDAWTAQILALSNKDPVAFKKKMDSLGYRSVNAIPVEYRQGVLETMRLAVR